MRCPNGHQSAQQNHAPKLDSQKPQSHAPFLHLTAPLRWPPLEKDSVFPTCPDVDVPGLDPAEGVLGDAAVRLRVHLLAVVLRPERGEHQVAVGQHLQEQGHGG